MFEMSLSGLLDVINCRAKLEFIPQTGVGFLLVLNKE